jgi:hypothetical protein
VWNTRNKRWQWTTELNPVEFVLPATSYGFVAQAYAEIRRYKLTKAFQLGLWSRWLAKLCGEADCDLSSAMLPPARCLGGTAEEW